MTTIAPAPRAYLESMGVDVPADYESLDPTTALALSIKADYEDAYGYEDGWDDVAFDVGQVIPSWSTELVQSYAARFRASTRDLLEMAEDWLRARADAE